MTISTSEATPLLILPELQPEPKPAPWFTRVTRHPTFKAFGPMLLIYSIGTLAVASIPPDDAEIGALWHIALAAMLTGQQATVALLGMEALTIFQKPENRHHGRPHAAFWPMLLTAVIMMASTLDHDQSMPGLIQPEASSPMDDIRDHAGAGLMLLYLSLASGGAMLVAMTAREYIEKEDARTRVGDLGEMTTKEIKDTNYRLMFSAAGDEHQAKREYVKAGLAAVEAAQQELELCRQCLRRKRVFPTAYCQRPCLPEHMQAFAKTAEDLRQIPDVPIFRKTPTAQQLVDAANTRRYAEAAAPT